MAQDPFQETLRLLGAVVAGMLTQWLTSPNRFKIRGKSKPKVKPSAPAMPRNGAGEEDPSSLDKEE